MKRILVLAGTRPEAIKVAPVIRALRALPADFQTRLCTTGQHREMLAQALADFELQPDVELDVMAPAQSLAGLSARLFGAIDDLLGQEQPDLVLVQGDTTTVQVASLCAFYRRMRVGHIEAGLRSRRMFEPFPEEMNRRIVTLASSLFFAPTQEARANLLAEGVAEDAVHVTGNTVIDALLDMTDQVRRSPPPLPARVEAWLASGRRSVLVTGHRRENFGQGMDDICAALKTLAERHPDVGFIYPVHLNPNVVRPVHAALDGVENILLEKPQSYRPFVRLLDACAVVLTDSGGLQEEAPSLGKPVLVMRDVTERPEGVAAGVSRLVGTDPQAIVSGVSTLLDDKAAYDAMAQKVNPYGDGHAGERIAKIVENALI